MNAAVHAVRSEPDGQLPWRLVPAAAARWSLSSAHPAPGRWAATYRLPAGCASPTSRPRPAWASSRSIQSRWPRGLQRGSVSGHQTLGSNGQERTGCLRREHNVGDLENARGPRGASLDHDRRITHVCERRATAHDHRPALADHLRACRDLQGAGDEVHARRHTESKS